MYPLKAFRVPCESLYVEEPVDDLPLVAVPDMLRLAFVGLNHIPLYYFDYIGEVGASWKARDRVAVVSSEQMAVCDMEGGVKRCVELADIVEIVVDQSEPQMKLHHLRDFLKKRKKYTRVYIRVSAGHNLLLHVVRDTPALLRALVSFSGGAKVRVVASSSQFESCVDTESLEPPATCREEDSKFRTPARSYITAPELLEKTLFKNIYERETRKLSMDASLTTLSRKSSCVSFRRAASFGSFLSSALTARSREGSITCPTCRRHSQQSLATAGSTSSHPRAGGLSRSNSDERRVPHVGSGQKVRFVTEHNIEMVGGRHGHDDTHDLKSAMRETSACNLPYVEQRAAKPVLEYQFPAMCDSECDSEEELRNTPAVMRLQTAAAASILDRACDVDDPPADGGCAETAAHVDPHLPPCTPPQPAAADAAAPVVPARGEPFSPAEVGTPVQPPTA